MISKTRIGLIPTPASSSVPWGFRAILPSASYRGGRFFYSKGFSLLELLLVLFIMGLMTATTMLMTGGVEDQSKFDETKRRMELIKRAIVGDPTRTVNGGPEISGFVADMGRLPGCLKELLEQEECTTANPLNLWAQDGASGIWAGWRGPYLDVVPDSDGAKRFRDGWGTAGDAPNYGWLFGSHSAAAGNACDGIATSLPADAVKLQSCGLDGKTGGTANSLDADYPATGNLIERADHVVDLGSDWETVEVEFRNTGTVDRTIQAASLRVWMNYPEDGGFQSWPASSTARNTSPYLSASFPVSVVWKLPSVTGKVAVSSGTITVPATDTASGTVTSINVTADGDVTFSADGSKLSLVGCPCTVTVPSGGLSGNAFTISTQGDAVFPMSKIAAVTVTADSLAKAILTAPAGSVCASDTLLNLPLGASVTLPAGSCVTANLPKVVVQNPQTATVSEAFTLSGTTLTTNTSGDTLSVPPGTTNPSGNSLDLPVSLPVPWGRRALTVVCESDGELYDGDCSSETGATPQPVPVTLISRGAPPANPSPIRWNIK